MTKLEIFCGEGGVGKTTTASSRALHLAKKNKVLLMTIDPSLRLKQVFGLTTQDKGIEKEITLNDACFHILLMDTSKSLEKVLGPVSGNGHIIHYLSQTKGGLNEIISLFELYEQLSSEKYDIIVLDTAPGRHFTDFLETTKKISDFFNHPFFEYFGHSNPTRSSLFTKVAKGGFKKLLGHLKFVTGQEFIDSFLATIEKLYEKRQRFLEATQLDRYLYHPQNTKWFYVTSAEQQKFADNADKKEQTMTFRNKIDVPLSLVINKSLKKELESWSPSHPDLAYLKKVMLSSEEEKKIQAKELYQDVLLFPEILNSCTKTQVLDLAQLWNDYE